MIDKHIKFRFIFLFLFFLLVSFFFIKKTMALFTDIESVLGNSIQVGTWEGTPPPSEPTLTPTPTEIEEQPGEPTVIPSPTPTLTLSPTPTTASQLADHIVFSEIQINGDNANQDFVELYNPLSTDVDLSGWQIRVRNSPGTEESLVLIGSGKTIKAHGFFLWTNDKDGYDISKGADVSNGNNLTQNYSLALKNSTGTIIDKVAWGNGTDPFIEGTSVPHNPATNQSIERKAYSTSDTPSMMSGADVSKGNAYDSENNANDFVLRTTSQPQNSSSSIEIP